jgi:hypothetical protein
MGNSKSEKKDEGALFKKEELIEMLMRFGNDYDETLAMSMNDADIHKILNEIIDNQNDSGKSQADILSILKKAKQ